MHLKRLTKTLAVLLCLALPGLGLAATSECCRDLAAASAARGPLEVSPERSSQATQVSPGNHGSPVASHGNHGSPVADHGGPEGHDLAFGSQGAAGATADGEGHPLAKTVGFCPVSSCPRPRWPPRGSVWPYPLPSSSPLPSRKASCWPNFPSPSIDLPDFSASNPIP